MNKKRIVLLGGGLASAFAIALFAARHPHRNSAEVRHVHRAEAGEPSPGDTSDETSTQSVEFDHHSVLAKSAVPKADEPRNVGAKPDSATTAPAPYVAPQAPEEIRAAAAAVRYVPLAKAPEPPTITDLPAAVSPQRPEPEPAVLNGDRPTQIRQYVAMQQSIERATLKLRALPEGDPAREKLTAFVADTQAQLARANRLLEAKQPTPSELASARAELDRLSAQAKPMTGPGG